jgi:hypothetical protein
MQKADVEALTAEIQLHAPVDVIIYDTLAAGTPGADENSAEAMGRALGHCKALHKQTGALVALIHHLGKDESKGARGWSGIKAAADAEITVSRVGDVSRIATVSKVKDGPDGTKYSFKLLPVTIGMDEDGELITSCIVEHISEAPRKQRTPKGKVEKQVLATARELSGLAGDPVPVEKLLEAVKAQRTGPAPGEKDNRRGTARRALDALIAEGFVALNGDMVEVPHDD